tara:strand:- start:179 stop:550 length:372 start_codon:yes stop_codon:yes gene_type:complete
MGTTCTVIMYDSTLEYYLHNTINFGGYIVGVGIHLYMRFNNEDDIRNMLEGPPIRSISDTVVEKYEDEEPNHRYLKNMEDIWDYGYVYVFENKQWLVKWYDTSGQYVPLSDYIRDEDIINYIK